MAIRTRFVDELLLEALAAPAHSIKTVLSVGCGLDTRPWRLDLAPDLRWIEIDFADMLDYKDGIMSGEKLRCRRERLTVDLNDPAQRTAMYEAAGPEPALMITEGLLLYLPAATVEALAVETFRNSSVSHWISDITTSALSKIPPAGADTMQSISPRRRPTAWQGEQILEVLQRHGWTTDALAKLHHRCRLRTRTSSVAMAAAPHRRPVRNFRPAIRQALSLRARVDDG
jgi:methyltransferase (TIGR00027 family)